MADLEGATAPEQRIRSIAVGLAAEAHRIGKRFTEESADGIPQPDEDYLILSETLRIWASVLSNSRIQETYVRSAEFGGETWVDSSHLQFLTQEVPILEAKMDRASINVLGNQLRSLLRSVLKRPEISQPFMAAANSADFLQFQLSVLSQLEKLDEQVLSRARARATSAAEASEKDAQAVARVAGRAADDGLSSFYDAMAKREEVSANTFRRLTVTMVFAAAAAAGLFILGPTWGWGWFSIAPDDYVHLVQRAILLAALFALAGYFARQAHQHRSLANWGGSLAVQLMTFDAYLAPIENQEVRDELRKSFAARVFGDHPAMKGEPSVTPSAAAMDTAVGWAAKLTAGGK